jgi:hypothetical protein
VHLSLHTNLSLLAYAKRIPAKIRRAALLSGNPKLTLS